MLFSEQFCQRHAAAGYGDEFRFGRQSDRMGHGVRDPSRANESPTKRIGALSAPSHLHGVNVIELHSAINSLICSTFTSPMVKYGNLIIGWSWRKS